MKLAISKNIRNLILIQFGIVIFSVGCGPMPAPVHEQLQEASTNTDSSDNSQLETGTETGGGTSASKKITDYKEILHWKEDVTSPFKDISVTLHEGESTDPSLKSVQFELQVPGGKAFSAFENSL